jgi:hypothetical protein
MSVRLTRSSLGQTDMGANLIKSRLKLSARASERMMKRAEVISKKPAAKSAAHEGVVARPMNANLSKILDMKRAQMLGRGTSVQRLQRNAAAEDEEALKKGKEASLNEGDLVSENEKLLQAGEKEIMMPEPGRGTSIARTKSVYTAAPIKRISTDKLRSFAPREDTDEGALDLPI